MRRIAGPSKPASRASHASLGISAEEMRLRASLASTVLGSKGMARLYFTRAEKHERLVERQNHQLEVLAGIWTMPTSQTVETDLQARNNSDGFRGCDRQKGLSFRCTLSKTNYMPILPSACLLLCLIPCLESGETAQAPTEAKPPQFVKSPITDDYSKEPYIFELIQTKARFEADGKSQREVTMRVRIQSESAVRELGRLTYSYASSLETAAVV